MSSKSVETVKNEIRTLMVHENNVLSALRGAKNAKLMSVQIAASKSTLEAYAACLNLLNEIPY